MQSRAIEFLVGFFVCLGIAAIFILTLRMSDVSGIGTPDGYTVTAEFNNIGGLQEGAPVNMAGVRIGRVGPIHLDQDTFDAVVDLHIQKGFKMPEDSSAAILTMGLLGNQYIGVEPGGSLENMAAGDSFKITQGAIVLEKVISQFMYSFASDGGSDDNDDDLFD